MYLANDVFFTNSLVSAIHELVNFILTTEHCINRDCVGSASVVYDTNSNMKLEIRLPMICWLLIALSN